MAIGIGALSLAVIALCCFRAQPTAATAKAMAQSVTNPMPPTTAITSGDHFSQTHALESGVACVKALEPAPPVSGA